MKQVGVGDFVTFRRIRKMEYSQVVVKRKQALEYKLLLLSFSLKSYVSLNDASYDEGCSGKLS